MKATPTFDPGTTFRDIANRLCHAIAKTEDDGHAVVTYWFWSTSKQRRIYAAEPDYVLAWRYERQEA